MSVVIQLRRGTSSEWTSANPTLAEGELGYETDTYLYKVGDGATAWNSLGYRELSPELDVSVYASQEVPPTAPTSDHVKLYARSYGGRQVLSQIGPSGIYTPFQPGVWANGFYLVSPGTSTAPNVIGGPTLTAVGTVSHPTLSAASLRTSLSRWQVVSAGTADAAAEQRVSFLRVWRGDADNRGGFFVSTTFILPSGADNERAFIGLTASTSALATTTNPATLTNVIGIGFATGDTALSIIHNDASGAPTMVSLGDTNFPSRSDNVYRLTLFAAPNGSTVSWQVQNLLDDTASRDGDNFNRFTYIYSVLRI